MPKPDDAVPRQMGIPRVPLIFFAKLAALFKTPRTPMHMVLDSHARRTKQKHLDCTAFHSDRDHDYEALDNSRNAFVMPLKQNSDVSMRFIELACLARVLRVASSAA